MQTFGITIYNRILSARYRARMEAVLCETGRCEKLSTCYRTASALITKIIGVLSNSDDALVDRHDYEQILFTDASLAGLPASSLVDVICVLDGEDRLLNSRSRCNTLALATISEALLQAHSRSCFGYEAEMMERVIVVLEAIEKIVCNEYTGAAAPRAALYRHIGKASCFF
jgi:hypothetical protein